MTRIGETLRRYPAFSWGLTLLLVLLLMVALGYGYRQLQERSEAPLFRVVINGEALVLDGESHAALGKEFSVLAGRLDLYLRDEMQPWLDARLDTAFSPLQAAIPDYLDWHFSLRGSYLRLAVALGGDLDEWLEAQLTERLIERSGIAASLEALESDFGVRLEQVQQRVVTEIGSKLHSRYANRQTTVASGTELPTIDLDLLLERTLQGHWDEARWGSSGAGGVVGFAAGRALTQRLVAGTAMQGSRALMARIAPRLGMHAARSVGTGAATTAATAPTGPAALMAGTVAAGMTLAGFAGTEYALLKAEESRYRNDMHAELEVELTRVKAEVRQTFETVATDRAQALEREFQAGMRHAEDSGQVPSQYRILGGR
ncbi:hypothetical protein [Billgrantia kenyensis]|uniref:Uncharacterized protein n=1 Tax=Billgrantia kenyensis TaxID=321266 RepID=A0A7V9VYT2_9GAMM|nr:hypothetical protein [Halomonas kenyensis]MBA2777777.1 hypothetical protein [Halomonas kenyensis]MCG6661248.1 hypothetical protein [Halomonas kenyensis]